MKKFLGILLSVSLLACTLCSCAAKDDAAKTEKNTTTANQAQTVNSDDETTSALTTTEATTTTAKSTAPSSTKTTTNKASDGSTSKTVKTTASQVKTTKKTTKATQAKSYSSNYEVSPSSVTTRKGKILRAWKVSSSTTSVELHKVAYGSTETRTFYKKNDSSMDVTSKTVTYQPIINVAIVSCSPTTLKFGAASQLVGKSMDSTDSIARSAGALIAINGQALESRNLATIRNGVAFSGDTAKGQILCIYKNGKWDQSWDKVSVNNSNMQQLINNGVYNTFRFQYSPLVCDGKPTYHDDPYYHNRTVLAQISENKYIFAVSEFMSLSNITDVLLAYGAKYAVITNGGNCSYMYVRGIGNVTGTNATQLKNLDKVNVVETEFFADHGMLGLNSAGKQKLGGPCYDAIDIVYAK